MIVAFDPGVTTGVATAEQVDGEWIFRSFQLNEIDFYKWVDEHCSDFTHFQVERFIITQASAKKDVVYDSLYLIGYLRYVAWRCGVPLAMSTPAEVMQSFPDESLKRVGWHRPGHVHANDAARHLARYMVMTRQMSGSRFLT